MERHLKIISLINFRVTNKFHRHSRIPTIRSNLIPVEIFKAVINYAIINSKCAIRYRNNRNPRCAIRKILQSASKRGQSG